MNDSVELFNYLNLKISKNEKRRNFKLGQGKLD